MNRYFILLTIISSFFLNNSLAQNIGEVDTTFGNEGWHFFSITENGNFYGVGISDFKRLPDGKIFGVGVVTGCGINGYSASFRFLENGMFDTTFHGKGYKFYSESTNGTLIPISDTDFYVFGHRILKINSDGEVSNVVAQSGSAENSYRSIDGSIFYVSSSQTSATPYPSYIVKHNSDFSLDTTFGVNGKVTFNSKYKLSSLTQDNEGNIYIVGTHFVDALTTRILIIKLKPNGELDQNFATNGIFEQYSSNIEIGRVGNLITITPDNKIMVFGNGKLISYIGSPRGLILLKLDLNGNYDTTFADGGKTSIDVVGQLTPSQYLPLADNSYLIMALSNNTIYSLKVNENGILDTDFGNNGYFSMPKFDWIGYHTKSFIYEGKLTTLARNMIWHCAQSKYEGVLTRHYVGVELRDYEISTQTENSAAGIVNGNGTYKFGDLAFIKAIPNEGFNFKEWTENGIVISDNDSLIFEVEANRNLMANFVQYFSISANALPINSGAVSGTGNFEIGEIANISAVPNFGYSFVNWTENGVEVSTEPTYQFEITANRNLTANFSLNNYTVSTTSNPEIGGTVTGNGNYNYGQIATISANPNTGYNFLNWTENGIEISNQANYEFEVIEDRNVVANFSINNYEISTISIPEIGGTVTGNGNYNYGQTVTLTATANEEYNFINWTENEIEVSNQLNYEFEVTGDRNIIANFSINKYTIEITSSPTEGGIIEGAGEYDYGQSVNLFAIANEGYDFINWTENGNEVSNENEYDFVIESNRNLQANFEMQMSTADLSNNSIIILPNPFDKFIQIKSMDSVIQRLQLFTLSGELLLDKIISNQAEFKLNTETVAKGIYILKVYYQSEIETFKVIKK